MDDFENDPAAGLPTDEMDSEDVVGVDKKLTADGGVMKKILVAGSGWAMPEKGDEVFVHYVGTLLDGSKFDSSRDRGDPFTFTLGQGAVIKGWDVGVATMKKGEKAMLTCRSDFAYGKHGSPPKIPADATLLFEVELLSWKSKKDLTSDGGVIKTITREATGWETPLEADDIVVTYAIRAAEGGDVLASGERAEFSLEQGLLGCKAFAIAALSMKKGEAATLKVQPEYAFESEAAAAAAGVPFGAPLAIDLELVALRRKEKVTPDGLVVKKILDDAPADVWERPNEGATVTLVGEARVEGGAVLQSWTEDAPLVFVTDEEAVPEGLDLAVMKMKRGERALITVPAAHAAGGALQPAPAGATLLYELRLTEVAKAKEAWDMKDVPEKIAAAEALKAAGNELFKAAKLSRAAKKYDRALKLIEYDNDYSQDEKKAARAVKLAVYSNLSAVKLKVKDFAEALKLCSKALEIDHGAVKVLFRRSQAYGALDYDVEAELDLKRALELEPDNRDCKQALAALKRKRADFDKAERARYAGMFAARPSKKSADAEPIPAAADPQMAA